MPRLMRQMLWLLVVPCGLAALLTLNPYELYLGVSLIFGMSVALSVLFLARGWWGVVVSIPVCLATYSMWGHAYSGLIFVLEGVLLTLVRNSRWGDRMLQKGTIIILDFIFWVVLGAPLYYFSHFQLVGIGYQGSLLIAQKSIVNGVINILVAYIVYVAITLWRNKRSSARQKISVQALSLVIMYTIVVLSTLFAVGILYNKLSAISSKTLYGELKEKALFVSAGAHQSGADHQAKEHFDGRLVGDSGKNGLVYYWNPVDSAENTFGTASAFYADLKSSSTNAVSKTKISKQISRLAREDGSSVRLLMPKQSSEKSLLKRYAQSYWEATFDEGHGPVTILQPAKRNFDELAEFYGSAMLTFNYNFASGVLLSALVAWTLRREFLVVLGIRSNTSPSAGIPDEERRLLLSPISEIEQLAKRVNERTDVIRRSKEKIEELNKIAQQQLSTAGEIQQCFLGSRRVSGAYPDVSLFMRPAYNAGGDWYDVFDLDGKTFIVVADVCDKGVGAALFMSVFRSLIRYSTETLCATSSESEPLDEVIASVNDYMATEHQDATMFATVFFACIGHQNQRLEYVLAGHEEPLLLDAQGNRQSFEVSGPAIGLFPKASYTKGSLPFGSGSVLVGYTDGVIDARNTSGESYGYDRLLALVRNLLSKGKIIESKSLLADIVSELDLHMSSAEQFDDITIATAIL